MAGFDKVGCTGCEFLGNRQEMMDSVLGNAFTAVFFPFDILLNNRLFLKEGPADRRHATSVGTRALVNAQGCSGAPGGARLKVPKDHRRASGIASSGRCSPPNHTITAKALGQLDDLMETGFIGKERKAIRETIVDLETSADACWQKKVKLRRDLFEHETEMAPIDAVITYDLP